MVYAGVFGCGGRLNGGRRAGRLDRSDSGRAVCAYGLYYCRRTRRTRAVSYTHLLVEMRGKERLVGNIYKGRVANILPGMQAAFVDVGLDKNAFLYAGDILCDESDFIFDGAQDSANVKKKLEVRCV